MIRQGNIGDLVELGLFCLECQGAMPWARHGLTMDTESTVRGLLGFITSPACDLSVVDLGEGISGVCAVAVTPYVLDNRQTIASEWIWHMRPSFTGGITKRKWVVRMLDHMMTFARSAGAHVFKANTIHDDKALASLLSRRGITPMETCCVGGL